MSDIRRLDPETIEQIAGDQIDQICDAFEEAWVDAQKPRIEDYLTSCSGPHRDILLAELLLVDREYRIRQGESVTRQDYRVRFPEYSTVIDSLELPTIDERVYRRPNCQTGAAGQYPGAVIAQFTLQNRLGIGASGVVWQALDIRLQRMVALKLPREEYLAAQERERFLREAQACAQLRHPNIVAVFEIGEHRGRIFIVAELIDGLDLRQWLTGQKPSYREAAELAAQLAEALHHAHEHGVVHRDLKPANVLIDKQGQSHIADFGLAKWSANRSGMSMDGQLVGTPAYMSPEQARGDAAAVDRRTDIYGLGALLYEMITAKALFEGDIAAVLHQVINDEPTPPRTVVVDVPRDLETICLKAIAKDPAHRYPSSQEMAVDLRRYLRGEPILARRISVFENLWRAAWRHRAITASIFLAVIAASALSVAGIFAQKNHRLLGLETVTVATDPPGAKITFVPLSEISGNPIVGEILEASGRSPVREKLKPRTYLVVAVLDQVRFHEVFRRVPGRDDTVPGIYKHSRWTRLPNGFVELPTVTIPEASVTDGMAYIDGTRRDVTDNETTSDSQSATIVRSFFVDTTEFTVADYTRAYKIRQPNDRRWKARPENYAMTASFDQAMDAAEISGKRLLTEAEFEFAATSQGMHRFPWGNSAPNITATLKSDIGPVGSPNFDRLSTTPHVTGLCSNVAEWTLSIGATDLATSFEQKLLHNKAWVADHRIVKGGDLDVINGFPTVDYDGYDVHERIAVPEYWIKPGLGFRCCRSASPRTQAADFNPEWGINF